MKSKVKYYMYISTCIKSMSQILTVNFEMMNQCGTEPEWMNNHRLEKKTEKKQTIGVDWFANFQPKFSSAFN